MAAAHCTEPVAEDQRAAACSSCGYVPVPAAVPDPAIAGFWRCVPRARVATLLSLPAAALVSLLVSCRGRGRLPLGYFLGPPQEFALTGQCGVVEHDIAYNLYDRGTPHDDVSNPEGCCTACQEQPRCQSWTWAPAVVAAGTAGHIAEHHSAGRGKVWSAAAAQGRCWLQDSLPTSRLTWPGAASGRAPPRQALDAVVTLDEKVPLPGLLFCFSIVAPYGHTKKLVAWQSSQNASIFACDSFAVYSNKSLQVGLGRQTTVIDQDMDCRKGTDEAWGFNAWMFVAIWRGVIEHGLWQSSEWTVKVDPEAVFFPGRLRDLLRLHRGAAYMTDCRAGVHGPVQVVSREALAVLAEDYAQSWDGQAPKLCMLQLQPVEFGNCTRDSFLDECLLRVLLDQPRLPEKRLSCQMACDCKDWIWCNSESVSFAPYRTVETYHQCMANSQAVEGRRL